MKRRHRQGCLHHDVVQRSHLVHHHADVRRPDRAFRVATAAASTAAAELPARRDRLSEPQAEGVGPGRAVGNLLVRHSAVKLRAHISLKLLRVLLNLVLEDLALRVQHVQVGVTFDGVGDELCEGDSGAGGCRKEQGGAVPAEGRVLPRAARRRTSYTTM